MLTNITLKKEILFSRVFCVTGRLRGGKTRLAFDIYRSYYPEYRLRANLPNVWQAQGIGVIPKSRPMKPSEAVAYYYAKSGEITPDYSYHTYNIIDEGGEFVRRERLASYLTRSAGKADAIYCFSGKRLPHKSLQELVLYPVFDFWLNFLIPIVLWRAEVTVGLSDRYKFYFAQYFPMMLHGYYSTGYPGTDVDYFANSAAITMIDLAYHEDKKGEYNVAITAQEIRELLED